MQKAVHIAPRRALGQRLDRAAKRAQSLMENAHASATQRAYASDWRDFTSWCVEFGFEPDTDDPAALLVYLADRSETLKLSTLERKVGAIRWIRRRMGKPIDGWAPQIRELLAGLRNERGCDKTPKLALRLEDVRQLMDAIPMTLRGVRDRALLLTMFIGALRSAEAVALRWSDLAPFDDGSLVLTLRRSKRTRADRPTDVVIPLSQETELCAVRALLDWRAALSAASGEAQEQAPIFRALTPQGEPTARALGSESVIRIVRQHAASVAARRGLNPEELANLLRELGSHSLRAGLITTAASAGVTAEDLISHTRHRRIETLKGYIRRIDPLERHPARLAGI